MVIAAREHTVEEVASSIAERVHGARSRFALPKATLALV
jgi:hypothetical protein